MIKIVRWAIVVQPTEKMRSIQIPLDIIVSNLLSVSRDVGLCLLDSCNVDDRGSNMLVAGICPIETLTVRNEDRATTLQVLNRELTGDKPAIFSLSYDLGRKLNFNDVNGPMLRVEPDIFVSVFDALLIHDYSAEKTFLTGNPDRHDEILDIVDRDVQIDRNLFARATNLRSNFTKREYLNAIEAIKEHIRCGNTYQTNLTQQFAAELPNELSAGTIFERLRRDHPAPFTALLERPCSSVISTSPERFFRVTGRKIFASPIKGTRPRGADPEIDLRLKNELLNSEKDRAENTMIVDLLRNDLGRICEFGSVKVDELCAIQELPTLFHLVSTIEGELTFDNRPAEIVKALFPCGSITGAPKLRTMRIIDELETAPRGLSMGAIGIYIPERGFGMSHLLDVSVAIRTMVIRNGRATFNVGGGIVIDSDPEMEYRESLIKARALLSALGVELDEIDIG